MVVDLTKLFGLKGKTAVITGAAGTICGEMAESLASCGVKTVLLDIDTKADEKAAAISMCLSVPQAPRIFPWEFH